VNTFDLHIIRRLSNSYLLLVAALVVFFVLLHYVEYIDDFMDKGATMKEVFTVYYPSYVPEIIRLISPLALFVSVVYLNGKLAQQLQLAALQTTGVSLYRLLVPFVVVATVITATMFWLNGWIIPHTNRTVLEFERQFLREGQRVVDVNDVHRQTSPGTIVSVGYFDRETQIGHRASLQTFGIDHRMRERIDAQRMEWIDSLQVWRFRSVVRRSFDSEGNERIFKSLTLDTTLAVYPRDFARTERDVESMTIPEAASYIQSLKRSGAGSLGRSSVAYHSKFAYPFANMILVLLGVPLASVRRRGGQAIQIGIGLVLAFVYLTLMKVIEPFGYNEQLPPAIASWLPHAVFLVGSIIYLIRVRK
jgi:lipopolysaccharide export system permease protein